MNAAALPALPALFHLPSFPAAPSLRGLAGWWERLGERRRQRAELRELSALGQHALNDLGIGGSELDYWVEAPQDAARD